MNAADVRAFIARVALGNAADVSPTLGSVQLRPHQVAAVRRLSALIAEHRGALLADPVGTGKTYTALTVAAAIAGDVLVIAPAPLREMWRDALAACSLSATIVSHESLSRGETPAMVPSLVIVDEAHRLRNPATRRYAAAAELCRNARVLLLSATPIQNSRNDLSAQIALFVGRRAWSLEDDALAAFVVRDAMRDARDLPEQIGPIPIELGVDDECVDQLAALPPPVPAREESIAASLLTFSLVHQWTSSRAALAASLRRRRTRSLAMLEALATGQLPSRAELAAWTHLGDAMQLAFPELVVAAPSPIQQDIDALRGAIEAHLDAVERLLARLATSPNADEARVAALRSIRRRHPNERIIAFCHYAETVAGLRALLAADSGVAALTAGGGRVAGGRISRTDVLTQFEPKTHRSAASAAERIELLLTTDVLSEGLNLQEASVVVHLDLPWNPARLEQRVGRVRRIGSRHPFVTIYSLMPPASAERLLRIDERLRDKLRVARRTVGIAGQILPSPIRFAGEHGLAENESAVRHRLRSWRTDAPVALAATPLTAACHAERQGFLALLSDKTLVAKLDDEITTSSSGILRALQLAEGPEVTADERVRRSALSEVVAWVQHRRGSDAVDLTIAAAARSRRAALARVSRALARAPRHRRAQLAPLAEAARSVASSSLAEGAERVLDMLVQADLPDEAWLRSIAAFGELNVRSTANSGATEPAHLLALILFQ